MLKNIYFAVIKFHFALEFSMKSIKVFVIIFVLFCSSCGFWRSAENADFNSIAISDDAKTGVPFESREPETFQTEIVVTTFLNGESSEKKYFLARSGNKLLTVFSRGEKAENSVLNDGAKTFFINGAAKTFRENQNVSNEVSAQDETLEFLTNEWLSRKTGASFEKLETNNNLTNYRIRLNDSSASEIILTYDESHKMPVKQEFYSISGEQKTLMMTIEMKNFQTPADEKLFVLPQDYKRVETK